ncbi:hypothetical protein QGN23_00980 [Chryseobacterium gotjawalense]|uniref:Secretion system C-terminal sorting domain-containing protein n=1 Tax=Chryseobacterium gotjawalense TaxID=3042315 RepID=A0ABY8RD10_9FLAO|nr:hypothetical protein [Chryseobacterium sp. wdc7]WHF51866.1 hypothetical protein QGN23_00980 [Chryseobacterium sp. wdc7]
MMRIKIFALVLLMPCIFVFSQTQIYFNYDDAGNQRYRGDSSSGRQSDATTQQTTAVSSQQNEEENFWAQIVVYPVPVKDILTLQWTTDADVLIDTVSMYQYGILNWNFQQKNLPHLNRQIQISMAGYYRGIYVLAFTLKNGRTYTKNIIKQ